MQICTLALPFLNSSSPYPCTGFDLSWGPTGPYMNSHVHTWEERTCGDIGQKKNIMQPDCISTVRCHAQIWILTRLNCWKWFLREPTVGVCFTLYRKWMLQFFPHFDSTPSLFIFNSFKQFKIYFLPTPLLDSDWLPVNLPFPALSLHLQMSANKCLKFLYNHHETVGQNLECDRQSVFGFGLHRNSAQKIGQKSADTKIRPFWPKMALSAEMAKFQPKIADCRPKMAVSAKNCWPKLVWSHRQVVGQKFWS